MKTAEQWVDGRDGLWSLTASYESDHTIEDLIKFVRRVQEDARVELLEELEQLNQIASRERRLQE